MSKFLFFQRYLISYVAHEKIICANEVLLPPFPARNERIREGGQGVRYSRKERSRYNTNTLLIWRSAAIPGNCLVQTEADKLRGKEIRYGHPA